MTRVTDAHLEARKNQILDAAWDCFGDRGYHETTMQHIASRAGISAGAIYRYFANKEAVLHAIIERSVTRDTQLLADLRAAAVQSIDALQLLAAMILTQMRETDFETQTRVLVEIRPQILRNKKLLAATRRDLDVVLTSLQSLMNEAQARGEIRADIDAEALALLSMSVYEGLRQLRLLDPERIKPEVCIALLRTILLTPTGPLSAARKGRGAGSR